MKRFLSVLVCLLLLFIFSFSVFASVSDDFPYIDQISYNFLLNAFCYDENNGSSTLRHDFICFMGSKDLCIELIYSSQVRIVFDLNPSNIYFRIFLIDDNVSSVVTPLIIKYYDLRNQGSVFGANGYNITVTDNGTTCSFNEFLYNATQISGYSFGYYYNFVDSNLRVIGSGIPFYPLRGFEEESSSVPSSEPSSVPSSEPSSSGSGGLPVATEPSIDDDGASSLPVSDPSFIVDDGSSLTSVDLSDSFFAAISWIASAFSKIIYLFDSVILYRDTSLLDLHIAISVFGILFAVLFVTVRSSVGNSISSVDRSRRRSGKQSEGE